jgi:hypothetical protein
MPRHVGHVTWHCEKTFLLDILALLPLVAHDEECKHPTFIE